MTEHAEELKIAEAFLSEMLEADRLGDYEGFVKHFDGADLEGFNESLFLEDTELMRDELGAYKDRSFLGSLEGFQCEEHPGALRFVWRGIYEKNEALIILGMHKKAGAWRVNENVISK